MRSRLPLLIILLAGSAFILPHVVHAAIPFYGPLIPKGLSVCPSNWAGLITVANNIISFLITITITFVAPLAFAYGGFLYLTSGSNPGNRSQANSLMLNTVVGICIALAGWLIVDALLAVLYNPAAVGASWYSLVTANGSTCINVAGSLSISNGATVTGIDASGNQYVSFDPNSATSGACSAGALQGLAPSLSTAQADTFACLAKYESTCGSTMQNYNWAGAKDPTKPSTAYGPFQVTLSGNHAAYENSACYQAAGVPGPLNCQNGFTPQGMPLSNSTESLCTKAASNLSCSLAAAAYVQQHQGWTAWTADKSSSNQGQCIQQYSTLGT